MSNSQRQLILIFISIYWSGILHSQELKDKLFKLNGDTIACRITLINDHNVFYDYNYKKGKIRNEFISTRELKGYIRDKNSKVEILTTEKLKDSSLNSSAINVNIDQSFWKPEYIILLNNDTLYGEARITGYSTSVMFKKKGETEENEYSVNDIKEFLESNNEYFSFHASPVNVKEYLISTDIYSGLHDQFLRTAISGPLYLLYRFIEEGHSYGGTYTQTKAKEYFFYKKGTAPFVIRELGFRDKGSLYFEDYPELALKIKNKIYKYDDIEKIVEEYNLWKLKK